MEITEESRGVRKLDCSSLADSQLKVAQEIIQLDLKLQATGDVVDELEDLLVDAERFSAKQDVDQSEACICVAFHVVAEIVTS